MVGGGETDSRGVLVAKGGSRKSLSKEDIKEEEKITSRGGGDQNPDLSSTTSLARSNLGGVYRGTWIFIRKECSVPLRPKKGGRKKRMILFEETRQNSGERGGSEHLKTGKLREHEEERQDGHFSKCPSNQTTPLAGL